MKLNLDAVCTTCFPKKDGDLCEECIAYMDLSYLLWGGWLEPGFGREESACEREDMFGSDILPYYDAGSIEIPF